MRIRLRSHDSVARCLFTLLPCILMGSIGSFIAGAGDAAEIEAEPEIGSAKYEPGSLQEEKLYDLSYSRVDRGFVWEGDSYRFRFWGNLKNLFTFHATDDDSLLNPDNIFDAPKLEDRAEAALKLNGSIIDRIGLIGRARLGLEYTKDGKGDLDYVDSLDQAYLSFEFGREVLTFLSIGKQRIQWGTGITWNPVDTFNPRQNLEDVEDIEEGKISYRIDVAFPLFSVTSVVVPNAESTDFTLDNFNPQRGNTLLTGKVYTFVANADLTLYLSGKEEEKPRFGASFSTVISDIQLFGQGIVWKGESEKDYFRVDTEREPAYDPIGGTHYTLPAVYDLYKKDRFFYKVDIGLQYTFSNDLTIIAEYYHNHDGYTSTDMETYADFLRYADGDYQDDVNSTIEAKEKNPLLPIPEYPSIQTLLEGGNSVYRFADLRRNYLSLSLSKPYVANRFDLKMDIIMNIDDLFDGSGVSLFLRPGVTYTAIPNWRFSIYSQAYIGKNDTDFGLNYYDFSLFGKIHYFF